MTIPKKGQPSEFDFFVDEDVRARRIGVLCLEKQLTPALSQVLFRVKENAFSYHQKRIGEKAAVTEDEKKNEIASVKKQIREVKWSGLNLMRSFVAREFLGQFFHYWSKGPLPVMFFNAPFTENHLISISDFFSKLPGLKVNTLNNLLCSRSVLFLDAFTTPAGYRLEEKIRNINNLSRCYRIDSRAHDLMQLTDLLLGITTYLKNKKSTESKAKQRVVSCFDQCQERYQKKHSGTFQSVYIL